MLAGYVYTRKRYTTTDICVKKKKKKSLKYKTYNNGTETFNGFSYVTK